MDFKSQYFEALGLDAHSYVLSIASFLLGAYLLIRLVREYVYRTRIGSSVRNKIEEDTEGEQAPELEQREHDVKIKLEPDLDHEHELKSIPKYYRIERWEDTTQSASASAERVIESKTVVPKTPIRRRKVAPWNSYNSPPETPLDDAPPTTKRRTRVQTATYQPETPRTLRSSIRVPTAAKTPSHVTILTPPSTTRKPPYIPPPADVEMPTFSPGDLVLRRRPSRFVHPGTVDADEYDGPFILHSTSNPAPAHLRHVRGAKWASWAKLDLPPASCAEEWIPESKLVRYTGPFTAKELREVTKGMDGTFTMDKIRNERWVQAKSGVLEREFKVSWLGYPCEDDTWEREGKVSNVDWQMVEDYESKKA